jgi:hypothetical protein
MEEVAKNGSQHVHACTQIANSSFVKTCCGGAGTITALQWSPDSELLALVLQAPAAGAASPNQAAVQIWQRSNWHWYLKQELAGWGGGSALHVAWEPEELSLHMRGSAGEHRLVSLAPFSAMACEYFAEWLQCVVATRACFNL